MHDDDDDDSYVAEEDEDDDDEDYRRDDDYDVVDNKSLIWPLKYLNSQLIHVIYIIFKHANHCHHIIHLIIHRLLVFVCMLIGWLYMLDDT